MSIEGRVTGIESRVTGIESNVESIDDKLGNLERGQTLTGRVDALSAAAE